MQPRRINADATRTEFSTRPRKHKHHHSLSGRHDHPNRTVFVPLFTFLILACPDDLHPQNLKSRISNRQYNPNPYSPLPSTISTTPTKSANTTYSTTFFPFTPTPLIRTPMP